jgi:hypothetical protein
LFPSDCLPAGGLGLLRTHAQLGAVVLGTWRISALARH